ncbi:MULTISPECIES: amidohydrolase family protein [Pseudomonas]|uniref:amidohydrolase family protein n=1 Tax=Pseudomonas TaxID=286 RepID=UPI000699574B|nr:MULTISPECIES: amidohydrolase family protein [Pseudomonas]MEB0106903.1 amidohydrolase family protein [Pseudomonas sp. MH9.3]WPX79484.1 amidohydrolase family protein [Pseudomonas sp. MH9.3]
MHMIATEEAFATPEYLEALGKFASTSTSDNVRYAAYFQTKPEAARGLCDVETRLANMDANGVDMHLMSLTSPGVQLFDADLGTSLAKQTNDYLAGLIRQYPTRIAGLAAIAPQDPVRAADEVKRAMTELGMHGIIINSHTNGEYLDERKFDPILEAAQRCQAPVYIHPTFPSGDMCKPMMPYGLSGAIWGFAAETGLHATRMVLGGVFDRFPELQVVLGHMGESLPFWLFRFDNIYKMMMSQGQVPPGMVKLERKPSEYIKSNIHITTSGMFWDQVLKFAIEALGADRVMFAIDYPYESSEIGAEWIRNAPISAEEKEMIMSGNAQRLFKIKP